MPLLKGRKNIGRNIKTEMAHGKKHDQAIAIAMNVAGMSKKKGMHKMPNGKMMKNSAMKMKKKKKKGYDFAKAERKLGVIY